MSTTRHITTFLFFVIIYFLLWINGGNGAEPPYAELEGGLNNSIEQTRERTRLVIDAEISDSKKAGQRDRVMPYLQKMQLVEQATDNIVRYLNGEQRELELLSNAAEGNKRADRRSLAQYVKESKLDQIRSRLDAHLELMLSTVATWGREEIDKQLSKPWKLLAEYPHYSSTKDLKAMLMVFENELVMAEYRIVSELFKESGCLGCGGWDHFAAMAIPDNSFAVPGQNVRATMSIINWNMSINPEVTCNQGKIVRTEHGVASWEDRASELGINKISGTETIDLGGRSETRDWEFAYMVVERGISMQLDKGNTCYIGVENPITISVPGYSEEALDLRVTGAEVQKMDEGHYHIRWEEIPKGRVFAQVDATNEQGTKSTVAGLELKVRMPPLPLPSIAGKNNGYLEKRELLDARGIDAEYEWHTDIDLEYEVTSYKLTVIRRKRDDHIQDVYGKGDQFRRSPEVMAALRSIRPGDRLAITDIRARDENGRKVALTPILLMIMD